MWFCVFSDDSLTAAVSLKETSHLIQVLHLMWRKGLNFALKFQYDLLSMLVAVELSQF
jgi:hypothetical protein